MASKTTQKQGDKKGPGPLLSLMMLFGDAEAADLFRGMRRFNGSPALSATAKTSQSAANIGSTYSGTCTRAATKRSTTRREPFCTTGVLRWEAGCWLYLCGPLNDTSINYISESIGRTYRYTYCMVRRMMEHIRNIQEKVLSGTCKTDEMYIRAASKGVPLEIGGEDCTLPSHRAIPRGSGRGTFEKNTPMANVYHQCATKDERDWTRFLLQRRVMTWGKARRR